MVLCVLFAKFVTGYGKTEDSEQNGSKHSHSQSGLSFFLNAISIFIVVPKYLNFATVSKAIQAIGTS